MQLLLFAAVLGAASPAAAQVADAPAPRAPEAVVAAAPDNPPAKKDDGDDLDMGQLMKFVDKIFPALPPPPADRLALARETANGVMPNGTYAALFDELMGGVVDRILSMTPADFDEKKSAGTEPGPALREKLAEGDPHFEERMRITRRVISEELVKISAVLEPKLRDGLALAIARRFDAGQLGQINAFLATSAGRAFGSQTMSMWVDPDVIRSMMQTFPDVMEAMPAATKRLEAATAHLPKPPKKAEESVDDEEPDDEEPGDEEPDEEEVEEELPVA